MKIYVPIDGWERLSEKRLACYRCFHVLPDNVYCVQNTDFFNVPVDESQIQRSRKNTQELFEEEAPDIRSSSHLSLEEAIAKHREEFAWTEEYEYD